MQLYEKNLRSRFRYSSDSLKQSSPCITLNPESFEVETTRAIQAGPLQPVYFAARDTYWASSDVDLGHG